MNRPCQSVVEHVQTVPAYKISHIMSQRDKAKCSVRTSGMESHSWPVHTRHKLENAKMHRIAKYK